MECNANEKERDPVYEQQHNISQAVLMGAGAHVV
jgi:hypothetical protein